jgi:hypothetical protein
MMIRFLDDDDVDDNDNAVYHGVARSKREVLAVSSFGHVLCDHRHNIPRQLQLRPVKTSEEKKKKEARVE